MPFPTFTLNSGHPIPGLAYGTGSHWRKNAPPVDANGVSSEVVDAIKAAAEAGFRHFDSAEVSIYTSHKTTRSSIHS